MRTTKKRAKKRAKKRNDGGLAIRDREGVVHWDGNWPTPNTRSAWLAELRGYSSDNFLSDVECKHSFYLNERYIVSKSRCDVTCLACLCLPIVRFP